MTARFRTASIAKSGHCFLWRLFVLLICVFLLFSFTRIGKYAARFKRFLSLENADASESIAIDKLIVRLDKVSLLILGFFPFDVDLCYCKEMRARKGKNLDLLSAAEDLTRAMHGARLTCCKSGKVDGSFLISGLKFVNKTFHRTVRPCP